MTKLSNLGVLTVGLFAGSMASATTVHIGASSIDGSLCVGNDCVASESFGFDTIRIKENNVRFHFNDTSTAASFPGNDWRFIANDSSNGGGNYLAIEDSDTSRQVFRVDAGAPANALRVDSSGDVGIGVANPVVDLHIATGNTPTLRLEQNGTSGFAAQTFDIASNEANFFIRDVSNGSQLPFRIEPGADTNALYIEDTNDVGIGTNAPTTQLHVRQTDGTAAILVEDVSSTQAGRGMFTMKNNGGSFIEMENTAASHSWFFTHENNAPNRFLITHTSLGGAEFILDDVGNLTLGGTITTTGSCSTPCDKVFAADYDLPSIEDHTAAMWENGYLPNVGPTPEQGQYDLSDKVLKMLNELEHAHIYIAQMNERVATLEAQLATKQ